MSIALTAKSKENSCKFVKNSLIARILAFLSRDVRRNHSFAWYFSLAQAAGKIFSHISLFSSAQFLEQFPLFDHEKILTFFLIVSFLADGASRTAFQATLAGISSIEQAVSQVILK